MSLKIRDVEFTGAITPTGGVDPGPLPQVAFSGRSNVGKSSLINRLLGRTRTQVARVSNTPGRTQEIHFYRVDAVMDGGPAAEFHLVDLPGYGYAKVPDAVRAKWRPMIEHYLSSSTRLRGVVQLLDARRGATEDDRTMIEYLASLGLPTLFVLTKIDKLKASERRQELPKVLAALGIDEDQLLLFSAKTGEGRDLLLESLGSLLTEEESQ